MRKDIAETKIPFHARKDIQRGTNYEQKSTMNDAQAPF